MGNEVFRKDTKESWGVITGETSDGKSWNIEGPEGGRTVKRDTYNTLWVVELGSSKKASKSSASAQETEEDHF